MESRFRTLDFLCKLQEVIGVMTILGAVLFGVVTVVYSADPAAPPTPASAAFLVAGIVVGLIFLGLQIIATAQVFQCLMQIEVNTRPPIAPHAGETPLPPLRPLEPRAIQQLFTTTGDSG